MSEIEKLKIKASLGDIDSALKLGEIYLFGQQVSRNLDEAIIWLCKSKSFGCAKAGFLLGNIYSNEKKYMNQNKAREAYMFSAEAGDVDAQYYIACCYIDGELFPENFNKACFWLQKAVKQGDEEALNVLLELVLVEPTSCVGSDMLSLLLDLYERKNKKAAYLLGVLFYQGKITKRNIFKSLYYFFMSFRLKRM